MGHQLRFFLTPTDLQLLEQRLRAQCPVAILDSRSEQSAPTMLSTLAVAESGKTWLKIFLVPPDLVDTLTFERVAQQGYWTVDLLRAPAVELSRCFYDGKILRVGRLFFHRGFYDEAGTWVEKPASFQAWAKKVLAVSRKELTKDAALDAYVGSDAQAERQQGSLTLVSN